MSTHVETPSTIRRGIRARVAALALLLAAISGGHLWASHSGPSWTGLLRPALALDKNPHPDIVEVNLVASQSHVRFHPFGPLTEVFTFNGTIPGPTIQAHVGDTLIVNFTNELDEETTIHWHGLELPANMDGSNIAQIAVAPGGHFRYEFQLLRAATFWYHPHIRSDVQVEKGLYGMLVVRDHAEDQALDLPWREHMLVLDDILLDEGGQVAEFDPADPLENAEMQVNGREGNTLLVNGNAFAVGLVRRGVPHRIRLLNTSNSRFMRVSIAGHRMFRIGGDGGLLESPIEIPPIALVPDPDDPGELISDPDLSKGLVLTPGERADVVFTPDAHVVKVEWHDMPRGRHSVFFTPDDTIGLGDAEDDGKRPRRRLLTLFTYGEDGPEYVPPAELRNIQPIDTTGAQTIPVTFGHTPPNTDGDITFFVQMKNGAPLPFPAVTPSDAPVVEVGDIRIWEVHNLTGGDHNFHPHGFTFQHLETEFIDLDDSDANVVIPASHLEDKDTIRLPKRSGARGRSRSITRLAVHFDDTGREGQTEAFGKAPGTDTSGGWVFHCHLLEHADRGMMSFVQVLNPDE